jgi:sugar phosphate isomerase/epimerase
MKSDQIRLGGTARSLEDINALHRLGLSFMEIPIQDPRAFSLQVASYRLIKADLDLDFLCHGPREGDPNDREGLEKKYFPKILSLLPLMESLGMPLLTIHLWLDPRFVSEEILDYKETFLRRILEETGKKGITLCIENLSEDASALTRFFQKFPALNLTLDLGHGELLSKVNTCYSFIEAIPEKIRHVHLHDNRGGDSYLDDLHLIPGEGIIDLKDIYHKLLAVGYKGTITLELKPAEIANCLERVKSWLK